MTATKYFINPFAVAGDVAAVPDDTQPSGAMSYEQGFTVNYELVQTDPSSRDVPRNQTNQLFLDLTSNVQQYQQIGAPNFITTAQNAGVPYPYNIYSVVVYDDGINGPRKFMSKKNTNTSLPTVTADWLFLDNTATDVAIDNVAFDGSVVTGNSVYYDSTSSTFKQALANGANPQKIIGFAHVASSRVFMTGIIGFLTGLTPGSTYYLSTTTPGALTTIMPSTNAVAVGFSKSTTELMINIQTDSFNPADLFSSSMAVNGYEINNETGSIRQWGSVEIPPSGTHSSNVGVTFPIPFPNNTFNIVASTDYLDDAIGALMEVHPQSKTLTGFQAQGYSSGGVIALSSTCSWHAIGN